MSGSNKKVVDMKDVKEKKEEESKEVATTSAASSAVASIAEMDFFADAGKGLEGADKDSFAIPFLSVLQSNSPQCDEDEGIEGARPGMLFNNVSKKVFKECQVIPVAFKRRYLRWTPRDDGGGFKGEMMPSEVDALVASGAAQKGMKDGKEANWLVYEGDEIKDTRIHFVLLKESEEADWKWAIMSLGSTQIKVSKQWLAAIGELRIKGPNGQPFNPPSFSHIYKVGAVKRENNKGKWYVMDVTLQGPVQDPAAYKMAKDYHAQIAAGTVVVKHEQDVTEDEAGEKF